MNTYIFVYKKPSSGKLRQVKVEALTESEALQKAPKQLTSDPAYLMYGLAGIEPDED